MNPESFYQRLGWQAITLDEPNMSCEFNTLMFFKTPRGVFAAASSGCSCPTPFEEYEAETEEGIEQLMEKCGSLDQAERIIDSWLPGASDYPSAVPHDEVMDAKRVLREWFKEIA